MDDSLVTEADVHCPHCDAALTIALDPGGGAAQDYVEDCQICCRPCGVHVRYRGGSVEVWLDAIA